MDSHCRWELGLVLGKPGWRSLATIFFTVICVIVWACSPIGSGDALAAWGWQRKPPSKPSDQPAKVSRKLTEVAPPSVLLDLQQEMDRYQPQVKILSPRSNEVLKGSTVSVRFQVNDLPIFKDATLGLGPHLHVLLDNQTYQAVYDLSQPIVFSDLQPGTHTIRAFASRPWHESFKNEGAYAQTTFHVFTKTQENSPDLKQPLLTYSRPQGSYGAEPIMLDFYLTNAPLHFVAREDGQDDIADWRIRCTINGESFVLDRWQPSYLTGFQPGQNWVQLEYLDETGNSIKNEFNNTARIINYEPGGSDTLSQLIRGELTIADVRGIVDPNYVPPAPEPAPIPEPSPEPEILPAPEPEESLVEEPLVQPSSPIDNTPSALESEGVPEEEIAPPVPGVPEMTEESAPVMAEPSTPEVAPVTQVAPSAPVPAEPGTGETVPLVTESDVVEAVPDVIEPPKVAEPMSVISQEQTASETSQEIGSELEELPIGESEPGTQASPSLPPVIESVVAGSDSEPAIEPSPVPISPETAERPIAPVSVPSSQPVVTPTPGPEAKPAQPPASFMARFGRQLREQASRVRDQAQQLLQPAAESDGSEPTSTQP